jgi:predicted dinucleotide-binding enzyme
MKIGVLGTGMVGEALGTKLVEVGHEVTMGSRTADNEHALKWVQNNGEMARSGTFADACSFGEVVINATHGNASLKALKTAKKKDLEGKLLIDVANIINKEDDGIARVALPDGDSLGEQLQKAFPKTNVVKTLNTISCLIMVNPRGVQGNHSVFLSGNDEVAKEQTKSLLFQFGWTADQLIDLGDITTARGPEMYLALWLRLMQKYGTPQFNISILR